MPIYRCDICNVEFTKKWNYNYHVSRKVPCKIESVDIEKKIESEIKVKETENTCQYCYKTYSTRSNLNKHSKICRFAKKEEIILLEIVSEESKPVIELEIELKESLSQIKEELSSQLKQELSEIKNILNEKNTESVMQTYNINNHFTFLTQIQQNTNVTNFGSEILDTLPPEFYYGLFSSPKHSVPRLIEKIHFDEERPSNMNIILPNKDLPFVYVYENDKWVIANKQTALNELMDTNLHRVDSFI